MKLHTAIALCIMAVVLGGCASASSETSVETTAAAETASEITDSASEEMTETTEESTDVTEEESSETMEGESTEAVTEETTEAEEGEISVQEEDPGYTEEDPDDFQGLLDECAGVNPYSSGSSLRAVRAAAQMLDWTEEMADMLSADGMKILVGEWKESRTDTELENLKESWGMVAGLMLDIAENPEGDSASQLTDTDYTLGHSSYRTDMVEMVTEAITTALEE